MYKVEGGVLAVIEVNPKTVYLQVLPEDKGTYYCEVEGGRSYAGRFRTEVIFYPRQPNFDSRCR